MIGQLWLGSVRISRAQIRNTLIDRLLIDRRLDSGLLDSRLLDIGTRIDGGLVDGGWAGLGLGGDAKLVQRGIGLRVRDSRRGQYSDRCRGGDEPGLTFPRATHELTLRRHKV